MREEEMNLRLLTATVWKIVSCYNLLMNKSYLTGNCCFCKTSRFNVVIATGLKSYFITKNYKITELKASLYYQNKYT